MHFRYVSVTALILIASCASGLPMVTPVPSAVPTALLTTAPTASATLTETAVPTATATPTALPSTPPVAITQRRLEATSLPETQFRYVFPVADTDTTYGHVHHDYMATDIFCPVGSPFVAVTDGVVEGVVSEDTWDAQTDDPAARSGLAVGIIGADGNRYYGSHLSAIAPGIAPGVAVKAGDLLGYTGKSGNAAQTPPHLHFGISRPSTPDDWQVRRGEMNPYLFLNAWRAGTPLQPFFGPEP